MSFTKRRPSRNRSAIVVTVATLHAVAIYGLVAGLGVKVAERIVNIPIGYNIEDPPPAPDPTPTPRDEVKHDKPKLQAPKPDEQPLVTDTNLIRPILPEIALPPLQDYWPIKPVASFKPIGPMPKGNPGLWATTSDYPTRDIRQGNEGTAQFLLTIGADGKVQNCTITRSSGHPGLDNATCKNISRRARFESATDAAGNRVTGTYSGSIKWVIPG